MHGKPSFKRQLKQLNRRAKMAKRPSVPSSQVWIGKWILQENSEGALEAVHSETGNAFLVADNVSGDADGYVPN